MSDLAWKPETEFGEIPQHFEYPQHFNCRTVLKPADRYGAWISDLRLESGLHAPQRFGDAPPEVWLPPKSARTCSHYFWGHRDATSVRYSRKLPCPECAADVGASIGAKFVTASPDGFAGAHFTLCLIPWKCEDGADGLSWWWVPMVAVPQDFAEECG
jgi:hypothetical protein